VNAQRPVARPGTLTVGAFVFPHPIRLAGMRVDGTISGDLRVAASQAQEAETAGYDAVWAAEVGHDPFLPLAIAAEHTEHIELGTGIAVAFGRTPMTVANVAWDLNAYSGGRFLLGLGSQIKAHIEKRYSMPWSHPAPRMREFVSAMRAIWAAWNDGEKLRFRGEFYRHTLMTPMFDPGPNPYGAPKVFVAAVGPHMTEVAGEVGDGLLAHGFTTERYLREVTLPALQRGTAASGRTRGDLQISYPGMIVTGNDEQEMATAVRSVKTQLAFYGSTPAYKPVLDLHGWGELQVDLNRLSKRGEWDAMADLIDDEVVDAFAVVAEPDQVAPKVLARWDGLVDRFSFYAPYRLSDDQRRTLLAGFRS
jgi:probable F420-dependent oxidoreductase